MSKITGNKFLEQYNDIADPISKLIVIHLYCEKGINKLIEVKEKKSIKVSQWRKPRKFNPLQNFVTKIYFVYNMGWISEELYNNLYLLNSWRNNFAHNIDVNLEKMNYDFDLLDDYNLEFTDKNDIQKNAEIIAIVTMAELHKCLLQEHNLEY